jgi:hypothetical protein
MPRIKKNVTSAPLEETTSENVIINNDELITENTTTYSEVQHKSKRGRKSKKELEMLNNNLIS